MFNADHVMLLYRNGTTKIIPIYELNHIQLINVKYVMINISATLFEDMYTLISADFIYEFNKIYSYEIVYGYSEDNSITMEGDVFDIYDIFRLVSFISSLEAIELLEGSLYEGSDVGFLQVFSAKFKFEDETLSFINLKDNTIDRLVELGIIPASINKTECHKHEYFYMLSFYKNQWFLNTNEFSDNNDYVAISNIGSFCLMEYRIFDLVTSIIEEFFNIMEYDHETETPLLFNKMMYNCAMFEEFSYMLYSALSLVVMIRRLFFPDRYTVLEYRAIGYSIDEDSSEESYNTHIVNLSNKNINDKIDFMKELKENFDKDKEIYLF